MGFLAICDELVGGFKHFFIFHNIWDVIFPIDELHHFSRWLKPPTSIDYIYTDLFRHIYTCIYLFACSCIDILNPKNPSDWSYVHQLRDSEKNGAPCGDGKP